MNVKEKLNSLNLLWIFLLLMVILLNSLVEGMYERKKRKKKPNLI